MKQYFQEFYNSSQWLALKKISFYQMILCCVISNILSIEAKWTNLIKDSTQLNCQFKEQSNSLYTFSSAQLGIQSSHKSYAIYGWWQLYIDTSPNRAVLTFSADQLSSNISNELLVLKFNSNNNFEITIQQSISFQSPIVTLDLQNQWNFLFLSITKNDDGTLNVNLQNENTVFIQQTIMAASFSLQNSANFGLFLDYYPFDTNYLIPSSCANVRNIYFYTGQYTLQDIQQYMRKEPQIIAHYLMNSPNQFEAIIDSSNNENNANIVNIASTNFNSQSNTNTLDFMNDSYIKIPQTINLFSQQEFILSFYIKITQTSPSWNSQVNGPNILCFQNLQSTILQLYLTGDSSQPTQDLNLKILNNQISTGLSLNLNQWNRVTISYYCYFESNQYQVQDNLYFNTQWSSNCLGGDSQDILFFQRSASAPKITWNIRDIIIFKGSLIRFQDTQGSKCQQLVGTQLGDGEGYCLLCENGSYFDGKNQCLDVNVYSPDIAQYNLELRQVSKDLVCIQNSLNRLIQTTDNTCQCSSQKLFINNLLSPDECQRCQSNCFKCGNSATQCLQYNQGYNNDGTCTKFNDGVNCVSLAKNNQFIKAENFISHTGLCSQNDNLTILSKAMLNNPKAITFQFTLNLVNGSINNTQFPFFQLQDQVNLAINLKIEIFYRSNQSLIELKVSFNSQYKFSLFSGLGNQLFYICLDLELQQIQVYIFYRSGQKLAYNQGPTGLSNQLTFEQIQLKFGGLQVTGQYCGTFLERYFIYINLSTISLVDKQKLTTLYQDNYKQYFVSDIYKYTSDNQYQMSDKSINNLINNQNIIQTSQIQILGIFQVYQSQKISFSQQQISDDQIFIVNFYFLVNNDDLTTVIDTEGWIVYSAMQSSNPLLNLQLQQSSVLKFGEYYFRFCFSSSCQNADTVKLLLNQWYHIVFTIEKIKQYNQSSVLKVKICINYTCQSLNFLETQQNFSVSSISSHLFSGPPHSQSVFNLSTIEVYSNRYISIATDYGYFDDNCFVQVSPQNEKKNCLLCMPNYLQKNYQCIPYDEKDLCQNSQNPSIFYFYYKQFNQCIQIQIPIKYCIQLQQTDISKCQVCISSTRDPSNFCRCYPQYYESNQQDCIPIKCDSICKTCQKSEDKCTACWDPLRDASKNCSCQDGFYEDQQSQICLPCDQKCKTCEYSSKNCLQCKDDYMNIIPTCQCYDGFFYDYSTESCQKCSSQCKKCQSVSNNCLECGLNRDNYPFCLCQLGYKEDAQGQCMPNEDGCSYDCEMCDLAFPSLCLKCKNPEQTGNGCECKDLNKYKNSVNCVECQSNQYFDSNSMSCHNCDVSCQTCQGGLNNQCLSCNSSLQLNSQKQCQCQDLNYFVDSNGQCKEGFDINDVTLNSDLQVTLTFSEDIKSSDQQLLNKGINLYLTQVNSQKFSQQIVSVQNNQLVMKVQVLESLTSEYLYVIIKDNTLIKNQNGTKMLKPKYKQKSYYFKVGPLILDTSEDQKHAVDKMNQITQFISNNDNNFLNAIFTFVKRFFIVFQILNTIQPISLMLLVNTQYPPILYSLLRIFGSFIFKNVPEEQQLTQQNVPQETYKFWYSMFTLNQNEIVLPSNQILINYGFIKNFIYIAQDAILQYLIIFILMCIIFIIFHYLNKKRFCLLQSLDQQHSLITFSEAKYIDSVIQIVMKFKSKMISQIFGLLDQSYLLIVFGIYLQVQNTLQEYQNSIFTRYGLYLSIIFTLFLVYYGANLFIALRKRNFKNKIHESQIKGETALEIFIQYDFFSRSYHFIGYLKKTIICFVVIQLINYPNIVVIAVPVIKICFFISQIYLKSFKNQKLKVFKIIGDSIIIATWFLIATNHYIFNYLKTLETIPKYYFNIYINIGLVTGVLIFLYNMIYLLIFILQNVPFEKIFSCCKTSKGINLIVQVIRDSGSKKNDQIGIEIQHLGIPLNKTQRNIIVVGKRIYKNPKVQKQISGSADLVKRTFSEMDSSYGDIKLCNQKTFQLK